MPQMRNIKLTIEYDGSGFSGWQVQPRARTVQDVLQKALGKMTGKKVTLQGASRTDACVHALAQVANFRTESKIACKNFVDGLNSLLPDDVSIKDACDVAPDFYAKRDSKGKHYRYLIMTGPARPALMRNRVWFIKNAVPAVDNINAAAQALVGEHDFSAFCASGDTNKSKVRRIDRIEASVIPAKAGISGNELDSRLRGNDTCLITIDITGNGFLKYMVRNIVGTLLNSKLKPDPKNLKMILESKDRKKAGVTAPASGLYLVEVFY